MKNAIHTFNKHCYKQRFYKQNQAKIGENRAKANQHLDTELYYLKIICVFHSYYHTTVVGYTLKNVPKSNSVCFNHIILLIMKKKMKNRSQRHDINRFRPRNRHKYTKWNMCLSMMMLIRIQQHLSNTWSSNHKKVKQHWGWVKKKHCLTKKGNQKFFFSKLKG